jgi:hypothetical protein
VKISRKLLPVEFRRVTPLVLIQVLGMNFIPPTTMGHDRVKNAGLVSVQVFIHCA